MSSSDKAKLVEQFPELLNQDILLSKEVLAHFGLLFSAFALAETAMINIFIFNYSTIEARRLDIKTELDWSALIDKNETSANKLTFGKLVNKIICISEFTNISNRLAEQKNVRNYFAHHFLREEAEYFNSDAGCWFLLAKMNSAREKIQELRNEMDQQFIQMCRRLGFSKPDESFIQRVISEEFSKAHEAVISGAAKVGWE